jgi:thioredoxin reductase (NADPH)
VDAIVISVGLVPNSEAFKKLDLKTDESNFILTDNAQRTSVEGVFAAGDITHSGLRLITVAASHGAIASHYLYSYIKKPYWAREAWPAEIDH